MLHAVHLPDHGGDTQFVNMHRAYEDLPAATRQRIDGLRAIHVYQSRHSERKLMALSEAARQRCPMRCCIRWCARIRRAAASRSTSIRSASRASSAWRRSEALPLLDELLAHATQPQYQYRHRWQPGDLVMWDNRCLLHKANGDYDMAQVRYLYRDHAEGRRAGVKMCWQWMTLGDCGTINASHRRDAGSVGGHRDRAMIATRLILKNWRNFRDVDARLRDTSYLLGANATGKSNLLDAFRFLRDVSKAQGGGLQKAVSDRGGIPKLRCLHARRDPEVRIEVHLADSADDPGPAWRYVLAFKPEGKGMQRTFVSAEQVWQGDVNLLSRPDDLDRDDPARLTQTHLEQIQANAQFRPIAEFLGEITYLHLVPQLLKYGDRIGGRLLEGDPFGQGFLEGVARTTARTRDARLHKIEKALALAVPQFKQLRFVRIPSMAIRTWRRCTRIIGQTLAGNGRSTSRMVR